MISKNIVVLMLDLLTNCWCNKLSDFQKTIHFLELKIIDENFHSDNQLHNSFLATKQYFHHHAVKTKKNWLV